MMQRRVLLVLTMVAVLAGCGMGERQRIVIEDTWVREAPPGARALAGYMRIHNHSDAQLALLFANSADFERVELHVTRHDNDRMRMEQVDHVALLPGEAVEFAPGGMHLMLMGPRRELKAGDRVRIELTFSDGTATDVVFPVRDARSSR